MAFRDTLHALMPTFFKAQSEGAALPMPTGGNRNIWWGDGRGPIFPGAGLGGRAQIDFAAAAGDVTRNSAVAACLNWICTNWADAPLKVGNLVGNKFEPIEGHPLEALIDQPNEDFNGKWLMWALLGDYYRYGRAYVHIVMGQRQPREIQYLPARCVTAVPDANGRLLRYDYKPNRDVFPIDKTLVVHFRFGLDPNNVLEGVPPLTSVLEEIVSDNAMARYPANQWHHGGQPPAVFTLAPPKDGTAPLDKDLATAYMTAVRDWMATHPGEAPLIPFALQYQVMGFKPSETALNELREEPESRIAALFGIPCIVVGLRAGMIRSTYSNTEQALKAAWTNCLVPLQKAFASEWTRQLLPLYAGIDGSVVQYDHSAVGVLQEDQMAKRAQAREDHKAGILTHDEARAEQGRDPLTDAEKDGLTPTEGTDDTAVVKSEAIKSEAIKSEGDVTWITLPGGRHIPIGADGKPAARQAGYGATTGEKTPSASTKSILAKQSAKYVGADIQRYSEEHNEPILASGVKGLSLRDNEPVDVIVLRKGKVAHGMELKTMVDNKANKITMKTSAMQRKADWMAEHNAPYHTVVFDDHAAYDASGGGKHDDSKRQIYYKRGFGSFRVSSMHPVKDMAELNRLMDTTEGELPSAAKPPASYPKLAKAA